MAGLELSALKHLFGNYVSLLLVVVFMLFYQMGIVVA